MSTSPQDIGDLYRVAEQFQQRVRRRDAATMQALVEAYGQVFQDVRPYFDALSLQIEGDINRGQIFTVDRMRRLRRYQELLAQVRRRVQGFGEYAATEIQRAQAQAVESAATDSARLMRLAVERAFLDVPDEVLRGALPPGMGPEVFSIVFNRVPVESLDFLIGSLGDGTPLRRYFLEGGVTDDAPPLADEVIDQIQRRLTEALTAGWNPHRAQALFSQAMGVGATRALRIARTEMMRSYREASRANYAVNGFEEYEWLATLDDRTCLACVALDGQRFPVEQPQRNHVNCRCTIVPVLPFVIPRTRRMAWPRDEIFEGTGADWFDSLNEVQQLTLMGPSKFRALRDGAVTLTDFIHADDHRAETFGIQFVEASLSSLLGSRALEYYQAR